MSDSGTANLARRARAALGIASQREFATLIDVNNASVARWERGEVEPLGAARTLLLVVASTPQTVEPVLRRAASARKRVREMLAPPK